MEVYFDESGSHAGAHALCVAGYMFEAEKAVTFSNEWCAALANFDLPYFRMSECAHGNGPFNAIHKSDRINLVISLIKLIHNYAEAAFAISIDETLYGGIVRELNPVNGGPYSFCAWTCVDAVIEYCERTEYPFENKISYFFESGHRDQAEANRMMKELSETPARIVSRYSGHQFRSKEASPPLQAADLLAWQWYTDKRHEIEGKPRRKDCAALLSKVFTLSSHISSEGIVATIQRRFEDKTLVRRFPEEIERLLALDF